MIAGHFGLAAAVKARRPSVPFYGLMLATAWLDIVFVPLLLTGAEGLVKAPDAQAAGYGAAFIHAWYTHSLLGAIVLSTIFGAFFAPRYGRTAAVVVGAVAFSHWLLDLIVHRPDLPLLPANALDLPLLGFGLWRYPTVSAGLELLIVVAGFALYWQGAVAANRRAAKSVGLAHAVGGAALAAGLIGLAVDFFSAG
ncbi:permease [Mesorhizobium intechi]|uniref:permease n=1 Tax=Mesorhizobium intechi TaxID=537601 RepID=UPI000CBE6EFE|nr:permease [Mesorhizobium intechi]TSE13747.1 permease [Mesorhizobium intechi]